MKIAETKTGAAPAKSNHSPFFQKKGHENGSPDLSEETSSFFQKSNNQSNLQLKSGAKNDSSPLSVMQSLGKGNAIDNHSRSKMEGAFGENFSDIQLHTDSHAAGLASSMNARAFAVGNHIAFGSGEYQPNTLVGDALMAHELAHVQQQRGATIQAKGENQAHEEEADSMALFTVQNLFDKKDNKVDKSILGKSHLSLQRCSKTDNVLAQKEKELIKYNEIINNPTKHTLAEIGAAKANTLILEHQIAVAKTGKGTVAGNRCPTQPSPGVARADCTTFVLDVLRFAFASKGQSATWDIVYNDAQKKGKKFKGTDLISSLNSKAGWKAVFWSPDPTNTADIRKDGTKDTEHLVAYNKVKKKGTYYGIPVEKENSIINYRRTNPSDSKDMSGIEKLKKVPFGVLTARGGNHMSLLISGVVYEVHWKTPETDPNVIEATPLENWGWSSGIVAMPENDYKTAFTQP